MQAFHQFEIVVRKSGKHTFRIRDGANEWEKEFVDPTWFSQDKPTLEFDCRPVHATPPLRWA